MQTPDTKPGPYYVSAINDGGGRWWPISGPYQNHADALQQVEAARIICERLDSRALWMAFGTVRVAPDFNKPGALQRAGYDLQMAKVTA